jgi:hypothetical protein
MVTIFEVTTLKKSFLHENQIKLEIALAYERISTNAQVSEVWYDLDVIRRRYVTLTESFSHGLSSPPVNDTTKPVD